MKMETKKEIFDKYKEKYYEAKGTLGKRKVLTKIIDTVRDVTGMGRKAIIRAFNRKQKQDPCTEEKRGRKVYYKPDVTAALKDI